MKKIGIIGIGGRTGTMFAFELKGKGEVFGIGREREISLIREKKLFIERGRGWECFEGNLIEEKEFPKNISFDFLFLTTKNPVGETIKFYFQKIQKEKSKIPVLFLSQNGIEAGEEAVLALKEVFGETDQVPVFRISLFNPIEKKTSEGKEIVSYSLPVKMAIGKISGEVEEKEIQEIFEGTNFQIFWVPQKETKNMEYSKLFLNLIGMASATYGLSIAEGFSKKEVFKEEFLALREYIKTVKKKGGRFLNFPRYPVKFLSLFFSLPWFLVFPFRKILARLVEKERRKKPKDLDEIEFYNGAVVKLGREIGLENKINEKILQRGKEILEKNVR